MTLGLIDRLDLIDRFNCALLMTDIVAYETSTSRCRRAIDP